MKIQPIDSQTYRQSISSDVAKPDFRSRLKRIFDRPFTNVMRISSTEKQLNAYGKDVVNVFEPSSICLAHLVQNFIEETNDKQSAVKCSRRHCDCFDGDKDDSAEDDFVISGCSFADFCNTLKSLAPCTSVSERNLLADISKIVDKNKHCNQKDELIKIVTAGVLALGCDASICKSQWESFPYCPAGDYQYIDAIVGGERLLIDIDFRSEFEIARPTKNYKTILEHLPYIFVGKEDRLEHLVLMVSEAAKLSLKKRGMHVPPWRKPDYVLKKWLSSYTRNTTNNTVAKKNKPPSSKPITADSDCGEFELIFGEEALSLEKDDEDTCRRGALKLSPLLPFSSSPVVISKKPLPWQPPAIKPRGDEKGTKVVPGLASLFKEKP